MDIERVLYCRVSQEQSIAPILAYMSGSIPIPQKKLAGNSARTNEVNHTRDAQAIPTQIYHMEAGRH